MDHNRHMKKTINALNQSKFSRTDCNLQIHARVDEEKEVDPN